VAIDIQQKLWPAMQDKDRPLFTLSRALEGLALLGIPIWVTEQKPDSLGPTLPQLQQALPEYNPISKSSFSCWREKSFAHALEQRGKKQILLMGIEAHVCITQTSLELVQTGYEVYVVADAVASSESHYKEWALARLRHQGVTVLPLESVFFELLGHAHHPRFKETLKIIKALHNYA
jgi:nicotinamidase-related amidase